MHYSATREVNKVEVLILTTPKLGMYVKLLIIVIVFCYAFFDFLLLRFVLRVRMIQHLLPYTSFSNKRPPDKPYEDL